MSQETLTEHASRDTADAARPNVQESPSGLGKYLSRLFTRPRPWLAFYLFISLPSAVAAPLFALPLLNWARSSLLRQALGERSLDALLQLTTGPLADMRLGGSGGDATLLFLLLAVCGVLLLWPLLGLGWVWLEGGALTTYADAERPAWRRFGAGCKRWFGPFLVVNVLGVLAVFVVGGLFVAIAALLWGVSPILGGGAGVMGCLFVGALATWTELARAVMVARDDRALGPALKGAWRVAFRRPLPLLALLLGGLALYGVLFLLNRAVTGALPYSWWLAVLVVQQLSVVLRLGVRLGRQAGEMGLAGSMFQAS